MQNKVSQWVCLLTVGILILSCSQQSDNHPIADMILHHAHIYPVKGQAVPNGAIVINDGEIIETGSTEVILKKYEKSEPQLYDCKGSFLMPGFIEGHGHFSSLGYNLIQLDLMETKSWQDIVDSVSYRVKRANPGEWITGRGWHQEKWTGTLDRNVNGYPYHDLLSSISPNNPVMLSHASGHALLANEAAMKKANVSPESPDPEGGHIVRDASGTALGIFEENAMEIVKAAHREHLKGLTKEEITREWNDAIRKVQKHCLQYGITSFQDAGSTFDEIKRYTKLAEDDSLDVRLWVMLRHPYDTLKGRMQGFPIVRVGEEMFTCKALKAQVDGALGSFGAWLLADYSDKPGFRGQNTTTIADISSIADIAITHNMQMCVHAIGDKANREVLNVFENIFKSHPEKKDLRWRIEHAQHLHPDDIPRFKQLGVIASMQGIHCTSDAPFVEKRLGEERARSGAYAWRNLLDQGVIIANGTDAPVERVDPIPNFYASVTRRREDTGQEFFTEQKMTREEALYSYTLGNAYAAFEDDIKGSIEPGKKADFVLLSQNLQSCSDDSILHTKVLMTMVGGRIKFQKE